MYEHRIITLTSSKVTTGDFEDEISLIDGAVDVGWEVVAMTSSLPGEINVLLRRKKTH